MPFNFSLFYFLIPLSPPLSIERVKEIANARRERERERKVKRKQINEGRERWKIGGKRRDKRDPRKKGGRERRRK